MNNLQYCLRSKRFRWIYWLKVGTRISWLQRSDYRWNKPWSRWSIRNFRRKKITFGNQGRTRAKQNKTKKCKKRGGFRAPLPLPLRPSISHLVNFFDGLARKCLLRRYPGPVDFSWNFSPLESPPPLPHPPALSHFDKNFEKNLKDQGSYAGCLQLKFSLF